MKQEEIEKLNILADKIRAADAILIGGGSGLSSAAGYNHYHWTDYMAKELKVFREYYGFKSPFEGFYHCFSCYGAQWGYYSQYIRSMQDAPTGKPYLDLKSIIGDKSCFVLTTNIDGQFERVFPQEQICSFQGNSDFCQCSQPCHDSVVDNHFMIEELSKHLDGIQIPEDRVPRCKECGRILVPWVRDDAFLEGKRWKDSIERYHQFLRHWLIDQKNKKLLLLELGVGEMTPSVIKLPFWTMAQENENIFYTCINQECSEAPAHLKGKSIYIAAELEDTLNRMRVLIEEMG